MAYQAEISRKNPGCFLFLVDQSESMEDPFGGGEAGRRKAEELATILNKLIHNLSIRCAKSDSIYDYFHVGVLGYSEESCKPALGGELSGRSLVPISELANKPLRIEERIKDRKSTRLNSSHRCISYAVFCLKKKNNKNTSIQI